ncbi:MAG: rbsC 7 [Enterovirga sp.]|nr:rbsC 7 [Enterovirga sp.]
MSPRLLVAPLAILVAAAAFGAAVPGFAAGGNLLNMASQMWVLALLAAGQTFALATRGFDISVGAVAALAGVAAAWAANTLGAVGLALGPVVGFACGMLNGLLIGTLGITPVIATLATLIGVRGIALLVTDDGQAVPLELDAASWVFSGGTALPPADWVALAAVVGAHLVLTRTMVGRRILMLGSNPDAVPLVGLDEARTLRHAYALCGCFAGLAGTLMMLRAGTGLPIEGSGMELQAIAAAVIGGTPLTGGMASVPGSAAGALLVQVLLTGLNTSGISPFVAQSAIGVVIIAAGLVAHGMHGFHLSPRRPRRRQP